LDFYLNLKFTEIGSKKKEFMRQLKRNYPEFEGILKERSKEIKLLNN
jgi:hypothetical protein